MIRFAIIVIATFTLPGSAQSCEIRAPLLDFENPTQYASDGSFTGAGIDAYHADNRAHVTGGVVRDVGGGRVAQRIGMNYICSGNNFLLFADCSSSQAILISGRQNMGSNGIELGTNIREIQPPHGPIALTASTTVSQLQALAASAGLSTITDFDQLMAEWPRRSRFEPLHGCSIFYPELVEAS